MKAPILTTAALAAVTVAVTGGVIVVSTVTASADTPGCVTHREYRSVHKGMTKRQVNRIFDTRGEFAGGGAGGYQQYYGSCQARRIGGGDGGAIIVYDTYHGCNRPPNQCSHLVAVKSWVGYA